jgi:gamma-glutamylputrescine oxidase
VLTKVIEQPDTGGWRKPLPRPEQTYFDVDALDVDVAVVGSGLTGLSAAYHVLGAHPGARVVVLEAGRIGHGASSRSTGMLTPGVGQNLPALVRRWGADTARAMYCCSLEAVEYVRKLASAEQIDASLRMTGQLVVACGPSGRRRLARQAEVLEMLGLPCERLDDRELSRHLRLVTDATGGDEEGPAALRLPVAGTLNPTRLLHGLSQAVSRRGGRIMEGAKVASLSRTSPVRLTLVDGRHLRAQHVVVATSGYASGLNLQRGRLVPLHLRVLLTEPLTPVQCAELGWPGREGVIDSRRLFNYFRLTEDDRLLFGGGRPRYLWGGKLTDQPAAGLDLDRLVQQFHGFFPWLRQLPIARSWTGVIAYSLDNLPVVGAAPGYERVLFVGGWCGHGIALSILSGRWAQEWIDSGTTPDTLPWFRPRAPLAPPEPLRWLVTRAASRAMETMDRF